MLFIVSLMAHLEPYKEKKTKSGVFQMASHVGDMLSCKRIPCENEVHTKQICLLEALSETPVIFRISVPWLTNNLGRGVEPSIGSPGKSLGLVSLERKVDLSLRGFLRNSQNIRVEHL